MTFQWPLRIIQMKLKKEEVVLEEIILLILEIVGTISFAVSGAFVAIKAKLDIFGVLIVGCVTAVGGGIMRDMLIGITPPTVFSNLYILLTAALSALAAFIFAYTHRKKFDTTLEKIEQVNNVFDAFGLAAFSIMGTEVAFVNGISGNVLLSIILGVFTGVGGGVLRDILTGTTPYIFKKHVYALASLGGVALYYGLRLVSVDNLLPSILGMVFVVTIRLLATKYRWSLPKIHFDE